MKKTCILIYCAAFLTANAAAQEFSHTVTEEGELKVTVISEDLVSGSLDITCDSLTSGVIINSNPVDLLCEDINKITVTGSQATDDIDLSEVSKSSFRNLGTVRIEAGLGNDSVIGSQVRDVIYGGVGNDTVKAGTGNDHVFGESGDDVIYGEAGNDKLVGDSGNDKLYGGAGNDNLSGDSGNDLLDGGPGKDKGSVGSGKDRAKGLENSSNRLPRLPPGFSY